MEKMVYSCDDFLAFQDVLKKMRKIDDNIVYALNTRIPTESFGRDTAKISNECKDLYSQLMNSYGQREEAITTCVQESSEVVKKIKQQRETNENDLDLLKKLRKEQTRLRLFQNELNVEEVLKDRSIKVFYERCRLFYKPPDVKGSA